MVPRIKRLDQTVVNRIAAGEVIHRPANAVKELLENSLDAGSTQIQITLKDGGLKLLQIQDNGHGIEVEDMPVVCERFTTSKLCTYDDLSSISTFGFRGEALASISHVSHLSIVTKTSQSELAYKAHYADGQLISPKPGQLPAQPRPCAGNNGTVITAEDLFYNVPTRRKALNNVVDEYNRVLDVCCRYAVHNAGVSISCRRQGCPTDLCTSSSSSVLDNISQIYGNHLARELLPVKFDGSAATTATTEQFQLTGYVTNANYHQRKMTLILFINNRLVESLTIKRQLEAVYGAYLPKGAHPWAYLSLTMPADRIDVNVHPTKREIHFLNQSEIVDRISAVLLGTLMATNASRLFTTQTVDSLLKHQQQQSLPITKTTNSAPIFSNAPASNRPSHLVRTDSRVRTLDSFLHRQPTPVAVPSSGSGQQVIPDDADKTSDSTQATTSRVKKPVEPFTKANDDSFPSQTVSSQPPIAAVNNENQSPNTKRLKVELSPDPSVINDGIKSTPLQAAPLQTLTDLTSVRELLAECAQNENSTLTVILRHHVFVGVADQRHALIQHDKNLYLVDFNVLSRDLAYQLMLEKFENCKRLSFTQPLDIAELLKHAARQTLDPADSTEENIKELVEFLQSKSEMLEEYFSIGINAIDCRLTTFPLLLDGYQICMDKLPMFLLRLALEVDWDEEKSCFRQICWELGLLYAAEPSASVATFDNTEYEQMIEHVLFPAFRSRLCPQRPRRRSEIGMDGDNHNLQLSAVVLIAQLPELYKVFERC